MPFSCALLTLFLSIPLLVLLLLLLLPNATPTTKMSRSASVAGLYQHQFHLQQQQQQHHQQQQHQQQLLQSPYLPPQQQQQFPYHSGDNGNYSSSSSNHFRGLTVPSHPFDNFQQVCRPVVALDTINLKERELGGKKWTVSLFTITLPSNDYHTKITEHG